MLLPHGLVVAVVDGEKLELYRNVGDEIAVDLARMQSPKLDAHNKSSGTRHVTSAANPGHLLREDAHAAAVVDWLNRQVMAGEITHLVIVAAPRTLGEMRLRYDKQLQAALLGEEHKELIGRSAEEVRAALR
ncbi:MAG: host attachment protein [Hyphomonadaceae bacterium]